MALIINISAICSRNPGIIAEIQLNPFEILKPKLIPIINKLNQKRQLEMEVTLKEVTMVNPICETEPFTKDSFVIEKAEGNTMIISVFNIKSHLESDIRLDFTLFNGYGKMTNTGTIDKIQLKVEILDLYEADPRPYVKISVLSFNIQPDNWEMGTKVDYIPSYLTNLITTNFKESLLYRYITEVVHKINTEVNEEINNSIKNMYPLIYNGEYDVSVKTGLTEAINIKDKNTFLKLNGTFFNRTEGDVSTGEPKEIDTSDPQEHLVDLYVSDYSANSLFSAFYGKEFTFGDDDIKCNLKVKPGPNAFSMIKDKIKLKDISLNFSVLYKGIKLTISTILKADIGVEFVNKKERLVKIKKKSISLSQFKLGGSIFGISYLSPFVKYGLYTFLTFKKTFNYKIPDFEIPYGIKIKDLVFKINEGFAKLGVDIDVEESQPEETNAIDQ